MDELTAFLLARLDEEEPSDRCGCLDANHIPVCTPQPWKDRERREIAAKRAIVERYKDALARQGDPDYSTAEADTQVWEYEHWILPNLAVRWSDHPDYKQEWKP